MIHEGRETLFKSLNDQSKTGVCTVDGPNGIKLRLTYDVSYKILRKDFFDSAGKKVSWEQAEKIASVG